MASFADVRPRPRRLRSRPACPPRRRSRSRGAWRRTRGRNRTRNDRRCRGGATAPPPGGSSYAASSAGLGHRHTRGRSLDDGGNLASPPWTPTLSGPDRWPCPRSFRCLGSAKRPQLSPSSAHSGEKGVGATATKLMYGNAREGISQTSKQNECPMGYQGTTSNLANSPLAASMT